MNDTAAPERKPTTESKGKKRAPKMATGNDADYLPTPFEQNAAFELLKKRRNCPSSRLKVTNSSPGEFGVSLVHEDSTIAEVLLMHSFGSANPCFVNAMMSQLGNLAVKDGRVDCVQLEKLLATAQAISPKDEIEAMLAVQMAAIHQATLDAAKYLRNSTTAPADAQFSNSLNKLSRTFATQVETLKKYRSTGEQSIKVQHVTVADGGQAIVGNVQTGGRGDINKMEHQPHGLEETSAASLAYASGAEMFGNVEALRPALQGAGSQRLESVPLSRSQGRSA